LAGVAANGGGDSFPNYGQEVVVIKNGGGSSITLTVTTPATVDGLAVADRTAVIAAGETRMVGPFPPGWYNDNQQPGGSVALGYSGVTSVTVAVVKVTPVA
ncbi:MAG TPA: hypothetical protein VGD87_12010, partial [Archangium sp.]